MPLVVQVVAPPASEPVSLVEAKAHLRVTFSDDDALITSLITAARRTIEVSGKIVCINTTFQLVDDWFPFTGGYLNRQARQFYGQFNGLSGNIYTGMLATNSGVITFPRAPLVSVSSVNYTDLNGASQTLDPSQYVVTTGSPGRMQVAFGKVWPVVLPQIGSVRIQFIAGFGADATTVPENVKAAIKLYLGHLYENREAVLIGQTPAGLPLGIEALLGVEAWGGYS